MFTEGRSINLGIASSRWKYHTGWSLKYIGEVMLTRIMTKIGNIASDENINVNVNVNDDKDKEKKIINK